MPPVGFEPTISAGERPQTYALDRAATGFGIIQIIQVKIHTSYLISFVLLIFYLMLRLRGISSLFYFYDFLINLVS